MSNTIKEKIGQRISDAIFERDLLSLSVKEFESSIKNIVKFHQKDTEINFVDALLLTDDNKTCALEYMISENSIELFIEILERYNDKFLSLEPNNWEFLLYYNSNDCHEYFVSFYGEEYFSKILSSNGNNVTRYSEEHFKRLYLNGDLDNFFKTEYLPQIHYNSFLMTLHGLIFFNEDKNAFKNFMFSNFTSELESDLPKESANLTKYFNLLGHLSPKAYTNGAGNRNVTLNLPNALEINILTKKWGIDKASEIVSEFINFQIEYFSQPSIVNKYNFHFEEREIINVLKENIEFKNCGKSLCFGLRTNLELLSYLIIKKAVTNDDLLNNIKNKELYHDAHHSILDSELTQKDIGNNRKLKI